MKNLIWILVPFALLMGCSTDEDKEQAVPEQVEVEINEAINVVK